MERAPAWVRELPRERIAILVYAASRDQAAAVVADPRHDGYVYATSGTLPHPWGTVPAYLREENGPLGGCGSPVKQRESRGRAMSSPTQVPTRHSHARSFALERFAWGAPDRLELAGTFSGLDEPPAGLPVLVLTGSDHTHRLPAAEADVSGAPKNGQPWRAAFVWQEPPAAFEAAMLRLGSDLAVELPEPGRRRRGAAARSSCAGAQRAGRRRGAAPARGRAARRARGAARGARDAAPRRGGAAPRARGPRRPSARAAPPTPRASAKASRRCARRPRRR